MAFSRPGKRKFTPSLSTPAAISTSKKPKSGIHVSNAVMASSNTPNAQAGLSSPDEPVNYRDLRAWLEEQERDPRPLSPLQQRAIADLRRSIEPKVDDRDWVSLLNSKSPSLLRHPSLHTLTNTYAQGFGKPTTAQFPPFPTSPPVMSAGFPAATSSSPRTRRR